MGKIILPTELPTPQKIPALPAYLKEDGFVNALFQPAQAHEPSERQHNPGDLQPGTSIRPRAGNKPGNQTSAWIEPLSLPQLEACPCRENVTKTLPTPRDHGCTPRTQRVHCLNEYKPLMRCTPGACNAASASTERKAAYCRPRKLSWAAWGPPKVIMPAA